MGYNKLENPPLWVWGIVVAAIIASKFIYRWQATKHFAKETEERTRKIKSDDKTKDLRNNDFYNNINNSDTTNVRAHKYSPRYYHKDYFTIKKKE